VRFWIEQSYRVVAPLGGIKPKFGRLRSLEEVQTNARGVRLPSRHDKALDKSIAPRDVDVIFVPGLAFDRSGVRLGQGSGWYDRALYQAHKGRAETKPLLTIGICFEYQLVEQVPSEAHDECVDMVITESQILQVAASVCL
jgi:5-formyltetrahydrofolate cyclo-ligase